MPSASSWIGASAPVCAEGIEAITVAAYVEQHPGSPATKK
jgi:hypothetical protein